jgi:hypothetical protein
MPPRPSYNHALLTLLALGVVLILVIGWILLTGDPGRSFRPATASSVSFGSFDAKLATPTAPSVRDRDEAPPTATTTSPESYPGALVETLPPTSTLTETPATPSVTPTPIGIQPLQVGKYDDTDPNIAYDPYWMELKNPSTARSYKGTIHASYNIGSEASFRFTGKGFRLGYKRGKSFGTVTVTIDGQSSSFNEQAFDLLWRSPQLSPGDHFVQIIHESGESVNLDYIVILD